MALVSSTDIMRWTFIKRRFPEILIFDAYALSFDLGAMKPDPVRLPGSARPGRAAGPRRPSSSTTWPRTWRGPRGWACQGIVYGPETDLAAELSRLDLLA